MWNASGSHIYLFNPFRLQGANVIQLQSGTVHLTVFLLTGGR
ncbi:hypothetical protein QF026_001464 [Streptomyces aurantiacus]|nr:hypothetical protein [Streptomyces aurantiacus]